jgi:hypothetical protein
MQKKTLFEPGDLVKSFTGNVGLVLSRETFEHIRGKVGRGRKPGHFFSPGCCENIDYLIQVPVFFEDGTYDIMKSMNIKAIPRGLGAIKSKLQKMLRNV